MRRDMMLTINEYLTQRGITPEQRARIEAHKNRMLLMQEHPNLPQISNEYE